MRKCDCRKAIVRTRKAQNTSWLSWYTPPPIENAVTISISFSLHAVPKIVYVIYLLCAVVYFKFPLVCTGTVFPLYLFHSRSLLDVVLLPAISTVCCRFCQSVSVEQECNVNSALTVFVCEREEASETEKRREKARERGSKPQRRSDPSERLQLNIVICIDAGVCIE